MADAAVRTANSDDVPDIARIHRETWRTAYRHLLPEEVLAGLGDTTQAWAEAVADGQVFVATEGSFLVGFCVAGRAPEAEVARADGTLPADAATTALLSVLVEPRWGRRGHGGRLLATAAQALRDNGNTRGIAWIPEADKASGGFYGKAGWESDGTVRTLDAGGRPLREIRVSGGLTLLLEA
ncbi:L-amino acid N-acyltransferase YncA [Saccharothrix tamanrassetensis]|uniref:L-amino acid N-acyltransferase YncA n=1 Tax=Saccharothrix tamanrassetensis TaxID=1051531 RepID=A0A841CI33_9PSEU|nr:GNAT family N-acetyltransferase [Saccharothrix tamanrassetensis]MBB5955665.1 L-amino acid N-acyltransferase YncA [Saccharothrix tamanrassetensis]